MDQIERVSGQRVGDNIVAANVDIAPASREAGEKTWIYVGYEDRSIRANPCGKPVRDGTGASPDF